MASSQGLKASERISAARQAGLSDTEILQGMKESSLYSDSFNKAYQAGLTDEDIAKDFGLNVNATYYGVMDPVTFQAKKKEPIDLQALQEEAMRESAKNDGETSMWESALLGASDLGAGVLQGIHYAADGISGAINNIAGTNLDTGSYERFTKQRKEIEDYHDLRRNANDQGFDWWRLGGQVAGTAPVGAVGVGRTVLATTGKSALTGAGIGASSFADDADQRAGNTVMSGIGGGFGGAIGSGLAKGIPKVVNSVRGNYASGVQDVLDTGAKHGVRVSAGDAGRNPIIQKSEVQSENIPLIGMSGYRKAQNTEAKQAATNIAEKLKVKLNDTDYKSLPKIQDAANNGDKNSIRILKVVEDVGNDSSRVLQASAEIKNWRGQQISNSMFGRVNHLAGNARVDPQNTVQAIDNVIASDSKVIPNDKLISEITKIRKNLTNSNINTSFAEMRTARSRLGELVDEWGAKGESTTGLTKIRTAIDNDLMDFAQNSGKPELFKEYKRANLFYQNLQKSRDTDLAKAMRSQTPDEIYKQFVRVGSGDRAANFYQNLDPKGQAALRSEMVKIALDKATNQSTGIFSPAKFSGEFERMREPYGKIFSGKDKLEMDGFIRLMRYVERSGQYMENPPTGNRATLFTVTAGLTALAKPLFTTNTGKRILLAAKDLPDNSKKLAYLLKQAEKLAAPTTSNTSKE